MKKKSANEPLIVPGFSFASASAGIKDEGNKDLALISSETPSVIAGVFTTNRIETYSASNQQDAELNMPMSYGIGLAYRFSDSFTIAGDIYRTHWDDFTLERDQGIETSPISGKNIDESDVDPTTWFRLGTEYLIITEQFVFPVRGGIFYDPAPADGSPDDYFGFSLGGGIGYQRYIFDIAYQFRRGNDVNASMWQGENLPIDVTEHKLYCSLIVYF